MTTTAKKVNVTTLRQMKADAERITMVTCYDATFARLCDRGGADVLLVGDSLGMVIQGETTTIPVTLDDIIYPPARSAAASSARTSWPTCRS
jgi:3-methyl-2-oxobutanoate hydroxymethyltransferase